MRWPEKVIEVEAPDCIEPYSYMPVYIWSGVGVLVVLAVILISVTSIVQSHRTQRQQQLLTRPPVTCPTCGEKVPKVRA